ncbi:MAG: glutaredoxin family protein [Betaproteobacteria bacterium]|nr:glutaredoxin family protein [Betaproteobacteria bacterium]
MVVLTGFDSVLLSAMPTMYARSCPKCNYVRRETDTAPDWQCPSCRTAYAKASAELAAARRAERVAAQPAPPPPKEPRIKLNWPVLIRAAGVVVFAGALAWGAYGKFVVKPATAPRVAAAVAAVPQLPVAVLYSMSSCPDCQATRDLLERRGVNTEIDIEKQPERHQHLIEKYNVSTFPILEVGDDFVAGFQPNEIERVLANASAKHL